MFCINCGKEITAESKFCGNCGSPVPLNGTPTMISDSVNAQTVSTQDSGTLLASLKNVSQYKGTPVMGYSMASGTLSIYNNRLEFKKKMGSALSSRGGIIGLSISEALAKNSPVEVFELEQISALREGKYMGVYNTLVVSLKNGEVWSFCPILPNSSEPKKLIYLLNPYMPK